MLTMITVVIIVWYVKSSYPRLQLTAVESRASWLRTSHPNYINVPTLIVDCVSVAVAFIPEGLPIAVTARCVN
jgi:sodium/potassium-transporting ATPase subunit alpha